MRVVRGGGGNLGRATSPSSRMMTRRGYDNASDCARRVSKGRGRPATLLDAGKNGCCEVDLEEVEGGEVV